MKRSILFIIILFVTFSARSQVIWRSGFVTTLEEYIFIPTEFDHFGKWLADIEKDTTLIFKKKEFTLQGDSLYLNFDIEKPGFTSPFSHAAHSVNIYGKTHTINNLRSLSKTGSGLRIKALPPEKVISIYISTRLSFAPSDEGKLLATEAMDSLEMKFSRYFENKKVIKSHKNIKKRKHHPEIEKEVRFTMKENPAARFWIRNTTLPDKNEISMYIAYELN